MRSGSRITSLGERTRHPDTLLHRSCSLILNVDFRESNCLIIGFKTGTPMHWLLLTTVHGKYLCLICCPEIPCQFAIIGRKTCFCIFTTLDTNKAPIHI